MSTPLTDAEIAEGAALLEQVATAMAETDAIAAHVLRRRLMDRAPWDTIAEEIDAPRADAVACFERIIGVIRDALAQQEEITGSGTPS